MNSGIGHPLLRSQTSNSRIMLAFPPFSRPGAGIDLSSLVVLEGKVCWDLYIDGLVVSSDGNLLDALAAAIKVSPPTRQVKSLLITPNRLRR